MLGARKFSAAEIGTMAHEALHSGQDAVVIRSLAEKLGITHESSLEQFKTLAYEYARQAHRHDGVLPDGELLQIAEHMRNVLEHSRFIEVSDSTGTTTLAPRLPLTTQQHAKATELLGHYHNYPYREWTTVRQDLAMTERSMQLIIELGSPQQRSV